MQGPAASGARAPSARPASPAACARARARACAWPRLALLCGQRVPAVAGFCMPQLSPRGLALWSAEHVPTSRCSPWRLLWQAGRTPQHPGGRADDKLSVSRGCRGTVPRTGASQRWGVGCLTVRGLAVGSRCGGPASCRGSEGLLRPLPGCQRFPRGPVACRSVALISPSHSCVCSVFKCPF